MNNTKTISASIVIGAIVIGILIMIAGFSPSVEDPQKKVIDAPVPDVIVSPTGEQTQIVEMTAKGGYSPGVVVAKAGIKTILRMTTKATYDCSSAISISALNYRKNLPASGVTDIEIPPQAAGTEILGTCAMGMYSFTLKFI
jgi:plastocyanin domain-containing protein